VVVVYVFVTVTLVSELVGAALTEAGLEEEEEMDVEAAAEGVEVGVSETREPVRL